MAQHLQEPGCGVAARADMANPASPSKQHASLGNTDWSLPIVSGV